MARRGGVAPARSFAHLAHGGVLRILPKDIRLACKVAALDLSMGHPEAAADRYDKALVIRPGDGDIIFLRAEVSALLGQEADA